MDIKDKIDVILTEMRGKDGSPEGAGGSSICICPECGYEVEHDKGSPCNEIKCDKCGAKMTGKGAPGDVS